MVTEVVNNLVEVEQVVIGCWLDRLPYAIWFKIR